MDHPPRATASSDALLDEASRALFDLGRFFARVPLRDRVADADPGSRSDPGPPAARSHVLAALTVEAGEADGGEVSVGWVAEQLGLDPSTASRLVSGAVAAGVLRRDPSPVDGRAARLALTSDGLALARGSRRYQRAVFDDITSDWTAEERREFARLFVRFAAGVVDTARAAGNNPTAPPTAPRTRRSGARHSDGG